MTELPLECKAIGSKAPAGRHYDFHNWRMTATRLLHGGPGMAI